MTCKIIGYINTIDSEGRFTFRGAEGYCLEKEGILYDVFWKVDGNITDTAFQLIACVQDALMMKAEKRKMSRLLKTAQVSHQKVLMEMKIDFENKMVALINVTLL